MIQVNGHYYSILASNEYKTVFIDHLNGGDIITYNEFSRIYSSDRFGCLNESEVEII
jgi:hypothetical protein